MPKQLSRPTANLFFAAAFIGLVVIVFTVGYRVAGWSWSDSIYMVIITAFSVGYEEVVPISSPWLRAWTIALIVLGCTGIIFVTGTLVQLLTELGLDMEEIHIGSDSPWLQRSVGDVEKELSGRMLTIAIQRKEGRIDVNPIPSTILMNGDALVVMKRSARS